jgi:hypothetical protein
MKKVAHTIADPKHSAGYASEASDCAVRAMANTFGVTYAYAHQAMKSAGRKDKKATPVSAIHSVVTKEHGGKVAHQLEHIGKGAGKRQVTIGTFCKYHPHGSFYCIVRGHALAIVDGVVQDAFRNRAGKRIYRAYEIV